MEIVQVQDDGFVSSVLGKEIFQPMSLRTKVENSLFDKNAGRSIRHRMLRVYRVRRP
jgi:hypothetical protein